MGTFSPVSPVLRIAFAAGIMLSMDRRWWMVGIVFILLAGAALIGRANLPALVEASPANGATRVHPDTPLTLAFSEAMQAESVAAHLEIEPPMRGDFGWEANLLTFTPDQNWPRGETITVTLRAGARSTWGLPLLRDQVWSFQVSAPLVVYLWPSDGPADLYAVDLFKGTSERLTETANGVLNYTVSADGREIFYSTRLDLQNSAILRLQRETGATATILNCANLLCSSPAISADGRMLAYTRAPSNPQSESFPQQVWLLPIEAGIPAPESQATLTSDPTHPSGAPFWSPSGILTFYDMAAQAFAALDPLTDQRVLFPNETGEPGTWAPDGTNFVVHEIEFWGSGPLDFTSHLWRFEYPSGKSTDLSQDLSLEDVSPAYAPDGQQIAFGRKYLDKARWIPGSQLWLVNASGNNPRQITDDPDYNHADFVWHPGGEYLVFVRYQQTTLIEPPEIWVIQADGTDARRLMIGGYEPQWIP